MDSGCLRGRAFEILQLDVGASGRGDLVIIKRLIKTGHFFFLPFNTSLLSYWLA